jgi:hypothetical protein
VNVTALDGAVLSAAQLLDRVRADGWFMILRGPVERLMTGDGWTGELQSAARSRGMQLTIHDMGRVALIVDAQREPALDGEENDPASTANGFTARTVAAMRNHPSQSSTLRLIRGGLVDNDQIVDNVANGDNHESVDGT